MRAKEWKLSMFARYRADQTHHDVIKGNDKMVGDVQLLLEEGYLCPLPLDCQHLWSHTA